MLAYCAGVEADVPCSCDIKLSPEHLGENRQDCESIHPPLRPVPPNAHFCDPKMVVQVERQAGKKKIMYLLLNH
jgi:hypothetical protein